MVGKISRCMDSLLVIRYFLRSAPTRAMPQKIHSGAFLSLLLAYSLLLTGCATIGGAPSERVTFTSRDTSVKLPPRERVATVTRETPERLANQGYGELGDLTVAYTKERCFGNDCDTKSHSEAPTERLLHEAAKHGGDIVILSQDNLSGSNPVTRQGKCLRTDMVQVPYQKCNYETVCRESTRVGSPPYCYQRQTSCQTDYRLGPKCVQVSTEFGSETVVKSVGGVWRYDPGLAKRTQEELRRKQFFLAVLSGDLRLVQDGLAQGLSPNASPTGRLPLIEAAERGHLAVVKLLVERGADVNAKDNAYGETALMRAAKGGYTETVKLLLARGADASVGPEGRLPLVVAAEGGHLAVVKLLIARGADVNGRNKGGATVLYVAAVAGHTEIVKALLARGADVSVGPEGRLPLVAAAEGGHLAVVKLLIARGADVNGRNKREAPEDVTALFAAAKVGHTEIVKVLLARGADVNVKIGWGITPLFTAARLGHTETVKALLAGGADANVRNKFGWTPLFIAAGEGHTETMRALLAHGANVNAKSEIGETALMSPAASGKTAAVQALLAGGADVNAKSDNGLTALIGAAKWGDTAAVQALLAKRADVSARDKDGGTALMYATKRGHTAVVNLLKQAGAKE